MPDSENKTPAQLKDGQDRALRSASPAIKRPASVMGAQDREEHTSDVEMSEGSGTGTGQSLGSSQSQSTVDTKNKHENGKRLRSIEPSDQSVPHTSDPRTVSQQAPSETSNSTVTESVLTSPSKASTSATSSTEASTMPEQIPSIDEQVLKVTQLVKEPLQDKQKGYVVSSKWLLRVQARSSVPPDGKGVAKVSLDSPVGPVDNSDIAMVIEESGNLKDEAGEQFVELRPNVSMGEDFEVLPQEAWDLIVSWYGLARTSPVITRYAHDTSDGGDIPNIIYELHPPVWSFLKVPSSHTPQTQRERELTPPRMSNSRYTQFQTWLRQAKELLHIDISTKVRVWRVLGGLKSTSASGVLTPAASRSASPAPGAELIASAGDKMLLDVNTFAALQLGEHRELLDVKDHTNDKNYNGRATLALHGLGRNDVIVLEEQGNKAEDWPSDNVKLSLGKNLQAKAKGLTASGRTSPASGMMTRGRQRRDGRARGTTGLSNLGNTCYMNSALQCIRSVEELTQYFLHDKWKLDLNVDNPLGHNGNVAKAYADLLHQIYGESTATSCNPGRFKATVGKYGPSFSGYGQQDSQEFLLFLLDGLQEDLNRIHKKPYIEKPDSTDEMVHDQEALKAFADKNWDIYKARNDSVVTDLFAGMYKSTVTCPVCDKVSIIFDPFNNLTLQLPIENNWQREILYFPLHTRPYRVDVEVDKNTTIRGLKEFVGKRTNYDPNKLIMAESYKNKFFKYFNNPDTISEINIGQHDIICIYELEETPTNYNPEKKKKAMSFSMSYSREPEDELVSIDSPEADQLLIPVFYRVIKQGSHRSTRTFFGQPSFVVIGRDDACSYDRIVKKLLRNVDNMTTRNFLDEDVPLSSSETTLEDSDTLVVTDDGSSSGSNLPKAASVEGEDGLVDVSMRDTSQPPTDEAMGNDETNSTVLHPETPLPNSLRNLFEIRIAATGEGVPTGWNSIEDNKEYSLIIERLPKKIPHRPGHSNSGDADGSSTSGDDLGDIDYAEPAARNDSGSDSGVSVRPASGNESDRSLPELPNLVKDTRGSKNRNNKKTFGGRDKRKQQPPNVRQPRVPPQPQVRAQPTAVAPRTNTGIAIVRPGDALVLDWDLDAYEALFGGSETDEDEMRGAPTWKEMDLLEDQELTTKRSVRQSRKKNGISLEDCLHEFGKSETLSEQNAWYCPRCKEHRRAQKMFELWKSPDILVMHLKRFSSNRSFRDKLEVRVDYPVEGLDLSEMVKDQTDGKSLIYDLIAVDNHYGGLGGGHYTAYAKNFIDGSWHDYNDSHVSNKDQTSVVTSAAYLLFYRRRSDGSLGGPTMAGLLAGADSEAQPGSREVSPSGEGPRLDDSSHNGLSSAYPAVQAHRVGDGGPAVIQDPMDHDLIPGVGSPLRIHEMKPSSELLPTYDQAIADPEEMLLDDEVVDATAAGPWVEQTWGWPSVRGGLAGHANSDADGFEDNSSTRGEGASPPGSLPDFDDADEMLHSEDAEDEHRRGMRESAPAPDVPAVRIGAIDDDDDELPVQELRADPEDPAGEMQFTPAHYQRG